MANNKITFTYLNIRQSIAILLAKLVFIDFLLAAIVVGFYFILVRGEEILGIILTNPPVFLTVFGIVGLFKILLSVYVVLLWLNEYYEITPDSIIHKKGIMFKNSTRYDLDKIRVMEIQDSFLGELFNYATITLYEIRLEKILDMYMIHNPIRYARVLKELRPDIEIKEDSIHLPFLPKKGLIKEHE